MCEPLQPDHVLGEERDGRGAGEDPPAVQAPPVAVLRPGHAQDEGDAVPGDQRARRPHQHVLARRRRSRPRARAQVRERDQDLGDRDPEVERDLAEHLQRDDHRGEVQPRVAQGRQHDRVRPAADRQTPARRAQLARGRSWAHMVLRCRVRSAGVRLSTASAWDRRCDESGHSSTGVGAAVRIGS